MIITGMDHFQSVCKKKLVEWYNKNHTQQRIDLSNVFVVWSCKTLQNYKALLSIIRLYCPQLYLVTVFTPSTHTTAINRNFMKMFTRK